MTAARISAGVAIVLLLGACTGETGHLRALAKSTAAFPTTWSGETSSSGPARAAAKSAGELPESAAAKAVPSAPPIAPALVTGDIDSAPVTRMRQEDALAVVIGITTYRGELPKADNAENDARVFAKYLHRTLGVPEQNIKLLLGAEASKGDIEAAVEEWLPAQVRHPGTPVYFFYSGHGAPDPSTGDGYLVPYDGDPAYLKSKGLALSRLYKSLAGTGGHVLAMLDACFSGAGGRSVLPKGLRPLVALRSPTLSEGTMAVLSATGPAEVTGPAPASAHGLFTYHLLRGLSGVADRDGDHQVSLYELNLFVSRAVAEDARRANRQQNPVLNTTGVAKAGDWLVVDGLVE